jgi:hypothetical protein
MSNPSGFLIALVTGTVALQVLAVAGVPHERRIEVLVASGGLPAHIAASFAEPVGFQRTMAGESYIFDRRNHAIFHVNAKQTGAQRIVAIGQEAGRIILPGAFDMAPDGTFAVADVPNHRERIQIFSPAGVRLGGFQLPGREVPRVMIGGLTLSGVGSLRYTGRSILLSQPERGALITEYSLSGTPIRTLGALRETGHESDPDLHLALNTGIPLADPEGGFYFVFQTGRPMFRKYDRDGQLLFERHIEGPELDPIIGALPNRWPERTAEDGMLPLVPPSIRTAAVDPAGRLWIGLTTPFVYQYDESGEKVRTVQFKGAGLITPASLFFDGPNRVLVTPGCYQFDVS